MKRQGLVIGLMVASLMGAALVVTPNAVADTNVKIGYIDMQKAIQETSAGKKAKRELETEFNRKKKELAKREASLKRMNESFQKKAMVLSDSVRKKKEQQLQMAMMKYRNLVGQSQLDIQKREMALTGPIIKGLRAAIDKIAKKGNFTVILEKSEQSVLWANKKIDLTRQVVKEYERDHKK